MSEKGVVNIIFVVAVIVLIGAIGYFAFVKKSAAPTQTQQIESGIPSDQIAYAKTRDVKRVTDL